MLTLWNRNRDRHPDRHTRILGDPWRDLDGLASRFDHLFDELQAASTRSAEGPPARVEDNGDAYSIELDVPGFAESEISVDASNEGIVVRGERAIKQPEGTRALRRERTSQRFSQAFAFPTKVDLEGVHATLENGVLSLKLKKSAKDQPRRITVRTV